MGLFRATTKDGSSLETLLREQLEDRPAWVLGATVAGGVIVDGPRWASKLAWPSLADSAGAVAPPSSAGVIIEPSLFVEEGAGAPELGPELTQRLTDAAVEDRVALLVRAVVSRLTPGAPLVLIGRAAKPSGPIRGAIRSLLSSGQADPPELAGDALLLARATDIQSRVVTAPSRLRVTWARVSPLRR